MKVKTISATVRIDKPEMLNMNERDIDRFVNSNITAQLAKELSASIPKQVIRTPILNHSYAPTPTAYMHPKYMTGYEYKAELVVLTPTELDQLIEDTRTRVKLELAMDLALAHHEFESDPC